jgi:hypothetical protein
MSDEMNSGAFRRADLERVHDETLVEHLGGPNDGEFRRADENGKRPGGTYVVVNAFCRIVAKRYVPQDGL